MAPHNTIYSRSPGMLGTAVVYHLHDFTGHARMSAMTKLLSATVIACSLFGLSACVVAPAPAPYVAPAAVYAPAPVYGPAVYGGPVVAGPVVAVGVGPCWRCGWGWGWHRRW
jgi:hypothetical protein